MKNLKELEQKYLELGKEIEALKKQNTEKEELKYTSYHYPMYCKGKDLSLVVKFTELQSGEVVVNSSPCKVGNKSTNWTKHTDTNVWQQLEVCEITGFFDGQLVWCWENIDTHSRYLRFYDVKNKSTFYYNGTRNGNYYSNYEPFEGNYPDWALEAFQTLER